MDALKGMPSVMFSSTAQILSLYGYISFLLVVRDSLGIP